MNKLVPFGKYKGQSVELMAQDREYCEWLMSQDWFRQRNPDLVTIIINHIGEPTETPEHNALQARFLDERFRKAFLEVSVGKEIPVNVVEGLRWRFRELQKEYRDTLNKMQRDRERYEEFQRNPWRPDVEQEHKNFEKVIRQSERWLQEYEWVSRLSVEQYLDEQREIWKGRTCTAEFEVSGFDVCLKGQACSSSYTYYVELKPSLGDDYPAVLRKMKSNMRAIQAPRSFLLVGEYTGVGVTWPQMVEVCATSAVHVVLLNVVVSKI